MPATLPASAHIRTYLKQIVYGGNDGIVTTFAIVAGFAGAQAEGAAQIGALAVLVFGLANLFADAVSMGMGEFLSARSQHQLYRQKRRSHLAQIHTIPEEAQRRLAHLLLQKGLPETAASDAARAFAQSPTLLAEQILTQENAGAAPENENPVANGLVTFAAFVVFGLLPLLPYLLQSAAANSFAYSLAATLLALALLGTLRSWATREALARALLETMGVGSLCALVAYLVGWLVAG